MTSAHDPTVTRMREVVAHYQNGDHTQDQAQAMVTRMAELAKDEKATVIEHRIGASFELARLHHRSQHHDAAMPDWTEGHRLLARPQPFSRDLHRGSVATVIAHHGTRRLRRRHRRSASYQRAPRVEFGPAPAFMRDEMTPLFSTDIEGNQTE